MPPADYLIFHMMKDEGLGDSRNRAEILADRVQAPGTQPLNCRWRVGWKLITAAHELASPTTSTMDVRPGRRQKPQIGFRHICCCALVKSATGRIHGFVLGFIHEKYDALLNTGARPGPDLKRTCECTPWRAFAQAQIKNIQVSWVKLGFETSLACRIKLGRQRFTEL